MSLPYLRKDRAEDLIQEELGKLMLREMEFDGALVTIVSVEVTKKLDYARVHVSILPSEKSEMVLERLTKAKHFLQGQLLRTINIKPMPELSFEIDRGLERAAHLEKTLLDEERKNS